MWMVDRVHGLTTGDRALAYPASTSGLTELKIRVIGVADLANRCTATGIDVPDFAGGHTQLSESTILGDQLNCCAC
jgi:hypothetical protein